jgi:hypothetical protein
MVGTRKVPWKFLFLAVLGLFFGCATPQPPVEVKNGLPSDKLASYRDTFEELRKDLWDPAGLVYQAEQLKNYQSAKMSIDNGQLVIRTSTGSFSKGGMVSTFKLRGDYDVQIDFQVDFLDAADDLDQIGAFAVMEESPAGSKFGLWVAMSLCKVAGKRSGVFTGYREGRTLREKSWHPIGDFDGSLRIVRTGDQISTFFRKEHRDWRRTNVFPSIGGDTLVGFTVQNYAMGRKSIHAAKEVVGRFDNFKINGAQEIIEAEI